jgi:agmatinase
MDPLFSSPTFLAADSLYNESPAIIIGCPLDSSATFRPGTGLAPQAIRDASWGLETYSPALDRDLEDLKLCDIGDLVLPTGNLEGGLEAIGNYIDTIMTDGKFPVILGGEHLISLPIVKEMAKHHPHLTVIQLDAHADLLQEYQGESLSHATVMKRIVDLLGGENICQLGIRSGTREEIRSAKAMGTLAEIGDTLHRTAGRPVYLTVDLDILDPSVAPGVGNPEPGGLTFHELTSIIDQLHGLHVVGVDIVELAPPYDPTQQSAVAAAKLVRELILRFCWNLNRP